MKREIGLVGAVIMGISGAMGFEIFVLMDYAYFHLAGSGIVLALMLGGLINLLIMFSYCELCAAIPEVGGEYTYIRTAFGGLVSFMSGCFRWLASIFGAALASLTFSQQLLYLISKIAPGVVAVKMPLIAIVAIVVLAALDIIGVKKAGTVIIIIIFTIFAVFLSSGLLHGLNPPELIPKPLSEGLSGVLAATAYMFPMFFGMRALVAGAPSIKDPGKNVPKGLLLCALLIIPVYFGLAYVAVSVISPEEVGSPFLNYTAEKIMGVAGGVLFAIAGMAASLSALGTSIAVQSSISRGMSRDGYFPKILLSVNQRFKTPYVAIIVGAVFIMLFSWIGYVEFLGYAASFGSLLVFALINLSLIKLRQKKPYLKRPFKCPFYPFTPIAGILMAITLLVYPLFLGDTNAVSALMSSLGLMALVITTYHLTLVGRYRLRVAFGGFNLGVGCFLALLVYLFERGFLATNAFQFPLQFLIFISIVFILAGILNVTTRTRKIF